MSEPQRPFGGALGRIPSGLFVLTMRQGEAETGMLVSWVQQCSFEPPQISVALKKGREIAGWLTEDAPFTLNILDSSQTDMIVHFGRGFGLDDRPFEGLEVSRPDGGAAVLSEALGYLQCRLVSRCPVGDHDLYIARVLAGQVMGEGQPMVHVRKSGFHY